MPRRRKRTTDEQKAQDAAKWEAEIAKRRYAVIVDEAHSSQSGETARELKAILGGGNKERRRGKTGLGGSTESGDAISRDVSRI